MQECLNLESQGHHLLTMRLWTRPLALLCPVSFSFKMRLLMTPTHRVLVVGRVNRWVNIHVNPVRGAQAVLEEVLVIIIWGKSKPSSMFYSFYSELVFL